MRTIKDYLLLSVKGAGMGAADVIPGVSGGTIAFMTGIFEELVGSINSVDATAIRLLLTGKIQAFWKHINGSFLLAVGSGILLSVLTLAKIMLYLLNNHPIETWAFFFGLIVASSLFILRGIEGWSLKAIIFLVLGIGLGVVVCTLSPTTTPDALWFVFLSGAIAICAMILPGISGSFILLILGKYKFIMEAITGLTTGQAVGENIVILGVFAVGAVCGLIAFSRFLNWLLARYHKQTLLVLAGFIIGSLVKVWPWNNMDAIMLAQFPQIPEMLQHISVEVVRIEYMKLIGQVDYQIGSAILFAIIGFSLVTGIEVAAKVIKRSK